MTDDEANRVLLADSPALLGAWANELPAKVCEAIWHALHAMIDRAALVEAVDGRPGPWDVRKSRATFDAARRHMKGES